MNIKLIPATAKPEEVIDWVELVLFLSDDSYLDKRKIRDWSQKFNSITVAGKGEHPPTQLPDGVAWYSYSGDSRRSEVWNHLVGAAHKEWVLFVEDDEQIRFSDFPSRTFIDSNTWCPALIRQKRKEHTRQFYHMRLVHTPVEGTVVFEGQSIPDCTRYIREREIELCNRPVLIERESSPIAHVDIEEELSVKSYSPKLYLVQGARYYRERKYVRAAAQYRQLLKKEKLLPFDRLAAVNGLASCMAEQHKWSKAMTLTEESLKAESIQALPYFIQFKIHELQKEWGNAHTALRRYYEQQSLYSRSSFDKVMNEESILVHLSDVALRAGDRHMASDYFEELFTYKREEVDRVLLYKVLVLSIELSNYERSVHLFNRMFKDVFPDKFDEKQKEKLNDIMTMFMNQEWYPFVANVYSKMCNAFPGDEVFKRRLIVSLTKTNRLDKARTMVSNII
ncbi:hypothetical protein SAMN05443144_1202 [Fodinibius roseus]|uniref:Tetratricopeptide repeat-containing protein n=1 Tax=Fodinibius roseus TaxID=1194090 RepID=A0A1M5HCQ0_9BACT|nr:tetratricopeptide repeat protein [Fodinibius roseus]SHG13740.1 hypothetical protein SAMN05443144_1202 [Fodinibius roseus]